MMKMTCVSMQRGWMVGGDLVMVMVSGEWERLLCYACVCMYVCMYVGIDIPCIGKLILYFVLITAREKLLISYLPYLVSFFHLLRQAKRLS